MQCRRVGASHPAVLLCGLPCCIRLGQPFEPFGKVIVPYQDARAEPRDGRTGVRGDQAFQVPKRDARVRGGFAPGVEGVGHMGLCCCEVASIPLAGH